jgi:hypothetical protein
MDGGGRLVRATCVVAVGGLLVLLLGGGAARGVGFARSAGAVIGTPESVAFTDVSCSSPRSCTAIGYLSSQPPRPVAERWNGRTWSLQRIPVPPNGFFAGDPASDLSSVSCPSAGECFAVVGQAWEGEHGFIARWVHAWVIQQSPPVPLSWLNGVSCSAPRSCLAVGTRDDAPDGDEAPLFEWWNGARWSVRGPHRSAYFDLESVSCPSTRLCMVVGNSPVATQAERWNGSSWSPERIPHTEALESNLSSVSCASITACVAVGDYDNLEGGESGWTGSSGLVADGWNGTQWSGLQKQRSPNFWRTVSCVSAHWCVAIETPGKVRRWNGTRWSTQLRSDGTLGAVTCTSIHFCIAIGQRGGEPASWRWNGTRWIEGTIKLPSLPTRLLINPTMPAGLVNQPYSAVLQASGGVPPYTWTLQGISGGTDDAWLSINSAGVLSGTPPSTGNWDVFVSVKDSEPDAQAVDQQLYLTVSP